MRKSVLFALALAVNLVAFSQTTSSITNGGNANLQGKSTTVVTPKAALLQMMHQANHQEEINNAASQERCAQTEKHNHLMSISSEYAEGRVQAEQTIDELIESFATSGAPRSLYTIPVVFHVIHKGEAVGVGTNISDAQLLSAIDALNRDFASTAADGGVAQSTDPAAAGDTQIEFCLASVDPSGNPTTGIVRVNGTSVTGYSAGGITNANEVDVKNLSRWDNRYYMNVWVVSEIDNNGADLANPNLWTGGTLGYAYFPTNPVTNNAQRDGIVAVNICVGNDPGGALGYRIWPATRLNRTLTHEVGHYLNLYHTFEANSCTQSNCATEGDRCCDTPPTTQQTNCGTPACSGTQQVENYLDYTGDACYNMFSNDQATRMVAVMTGVRNALTNTSNCTPPNGWDAGITAVIDPSGSICESTISPVITLRNNGANTLTSVDIEYDIDGAGTQTFAWTGSLTSNQTEDVALPAMAVTPGAFTFNATTVSGTLNGTNVDEDLANDASSSPFTVLNANNTVTLSLTTDNYGYEIAWQVIDAGTNVVAEGGNLSVIPGGAQGAAPTDPGAYGNSVTVTENFCLADGCFDFVIYDDYGDGICCAEGNGSYTLTDDATTTVLASGGTFTVTQSTNFCLSSAAAPPVADFEGVPLTVLDGGTVDFTDLSTGNPAITTWQWNITGPGTATPSNPTTQNPSVVFNGVGLYTVELTVTNAEGSDIETKVDYIEVVESLCADPLSTAYTMGFETGEDLSGWVVVNQNADANTWNIYDFSGAPQGAQEGTNVAGYFYNAAQAANDWLITSCFDLEAGANYTMTYYWSTGAGYDENLSVYLGTAQTPAGMTTNLQTLNSVSNNGWTQETINFTVPSNGEYYIGWHCTSIADQWYIAIDAINLTGVQPIITVTNTPTDVSINCEASTLPSNTGEFTATSNCTGGATVGYSDVITAGSCVNDFVITRTWTATDGCGNSETHVQTITVSDNTAPVVNCGISTDEIFTSGGSATLPNYVTGGTFSDNCTATGDLIIVQSPAAGTTHSSDVVVTITTTDECGNSTACVINVTVTDNEFITVTSTPADVSISCDDSDLPANTGSMTATTGCGTGGLNVSHADVITTGSCVNNYVITRTWTATDNCGNSETHVQTITVSDNTAPVVSCGISVDEIFTSGGSATLPNYVTGGTFSDNCTATGDLIIAQSPAAGTTHSSDVVVTITTTDECGNSTVCVINVTVTDNEFITVTSTPADISISCEDSDLPANTGSMTATTGCGTGGLNVSHADVITAGSCVNNYVITRTWTATDNCGNSETHVQTITVSDNTAPVVDCGISNDEITATSGSAILPDYTPGASATDNCTASGDITITQSPVGGSSVGSGTTTVTITAEDECGNTSTCTISVLVVNDDGITLINTPANVTIECDESTLPANTGNVTASTTCASGVVNINYSDVSNGTCPQVITRTWTVTDDCASSETYVQTITIEDNTAPTGVAPTNVTVSCAIDVPAVNTASVTGVSDNCSASPAVTHISDVSDGNTCAEVITRTYRVADDCGNFIDVVQTITIDDNTAPTGMAPTNVTVSCTADVPAVNTASVTGVSDNCTASPVVTHVSDVSDGNTCAEVITRTYRIADDCGNFIDVVQTITVNDDEAPVLDCSVTEESFSLSQNPVCPDYTATATVTDNCSSVTVNQSPAAGSALSTGANTVTLSSTDDCGNTSTCTITVTVDDDLSFKENFVNVVSIYPNPTTGNLYVDLTNTGMSNFSIVVYDMAGKLLIEMFEKEAANVEVDLSTLATGMYQIKVSSEDVVLVKKITKH